MASMKVSKLVCVSNIRHEGIRYLDCCPECGCPVEYQTRTILTKRAPKETWVEIMNARTTAKQDILLKMALRDPDLKPVELKLPVSEHCRIPYCPANPAHSAFNPLSLPLCVECGSLVQEMHLATVASSNVKSVAYQDYLQRRTKWFKKVGDEDVEAGKQSSATG